MRRTLGDRFWAKVQITGCCWYWTAGGTDGYGQIYAGGKVRQAHHIAWELLVGPLPEGLVSDHLCRNRSCVNPDHLDWVENAENLRRGIGGRLKTHCKHGHEFTEDNTKWIKGHRNCRMCKRIDSRTRYREKHNIQPTQYRKRVH